MPGCDDSDSSYSTAPPSVYFRDQTEPDFCRRPVVDPSSYGNWSSCATGVVAFAPCSSSSSSGDPVAYAPFEFESTLVTELGLVCEERYKVALVGTFYMLGLLFGSLIGSYPADRFRIKSSTITRFTKMHLKQ